MMTAEKTPARFSLATRVAGMLLALLYVALAGGVGLFVRPLDYKVLVLLALVPAAVALLAGLVKLARVRPWGVLALFHLVVYPLFAAVVLGVPGVIVAMLVAEMFP